MKALHQDCPGAIENTGKIDEWFKAHGLLLNQIPLGDDRMIIVAFGKHCYEVLDIYWIFWQCLLLPQ